MINHNIEVIALLSGAALGDLDWLNLVVFGDSRGLGGQGGGAAPSRRRFALQENQTIFKSRIT